MKLAPHHMLGGSETGRWLQLPGLAAAKAVGDLGALSAAQPSTLTIGRMVDDGQLDGQGFDMNRQRKVQTPDQAAAQYVAFLLPYIQSNPWVQVWEGPNEQVFERDDAREAADPVFKAQADADRQATMLWYADFCYEFARRLHALGKRAGIGSWPSGNPLPQHDLLRLYGQALDATIEFGAIECRHDYTGADPGGLLRCVYDNAQFEKLGYFRVPQALTELGVDADGKDWRTLFGSWDNCFASVVKPWLDQAENLPWLIAGCWFTDGGAGWPTFDISGTNIVATLAAYTPPPKEPPMNSYIPLVLITDNSLPNALRLAQHVTDMVADFNAAGDVSDYVKIHTAPPATSPTGKGIFIWQLAHTAGGNPAAAVALARSAGLSWVAVKVHDGTTIDDSQLLRDFAAAVHAAHIQVYGWGYCYLRLAQPEANAAAIQVQALSLDGYIIDAEGEAAAAGAGPAAQFANTLKLGIHKPIGLSSYRYPSLHMDLPWAELLAPCTFHCPQVYWLANVDPLGPGKQLDRSVNELMNLAALPVVPIGCAFSWTPPSGAQWSPTIAQLQNFIEAARLHGATCPGYAWWSWESASAQPTWWAAIAGAAVG